MGPFAKTTLRLMASTLEALGSAGANLTRPRDRGANVDTQNGSRSATDDACCERDNVSRTRAGRRDFRDMKH